LKTGNWPASPVRNLLNDQAGKSGIEEKIPCILPGLSGKNGNAISGPKIYRCFIWHLNPEKHANAKKQFDMRWKS